MPTDAELQAYLDDAAPPERMAAVEALLRDELLRDDATLRQRLAMLVAGRDAGLHSLGQVWRRRRLTCPTREQLGSHLLGVLSQEITDYISFHVEVAECHLCGASLEDLREQAATDAEPITERRQRYFESSVGRLRQ